MPLQSTSGAASYDAFGGGTVAKVNYIEDFFQSYLRTGTGASASVTTGLDGSTKETLVWTKSRSAATNHKLTDNVRGATKALSSNTTSAEATDSQGLTAFSATGYTLGTNTDYNNSGATYVDWQWVSQPKFFDVVTYTGTGSIRTVAHNLGSAPGCMIIKQTSASGEYWGVYHRSLGATKRMYLNTTAAEATNAAFWDNTNPTSTEFTVGAEGTVNSNGASYVAYLFAHNAGGFGLTGTDNVISCGSFTTDGSGSATVSLGYEPQWLLVKSTGVAQNWFLMDTIRGMSYSASLNLKPNTSGAEADFGPNVFVPTATGFVETAGLSASQTYIYIAIRRGPMKVPTSGTSVFAPITYAGTNTAGQVISGANFPPDLSIPFSRAGAGGAVSQFIDRLRGGTAYLAPSSTAAEGNTAGYYIRSFDMDGVTYGTAYLDYTNSAYNYVNWMFRRAPSFFDEVCYTGTGSATTFTHNLQAVPELMIVKTRSLTERDWVVYSSALGATKGFYLNQPDAAVTSSTFWNNTTPTSSVFTVNTSGGVNLSAATYVAYLFATCTGVSKVGSYTGNGSTQTIDCGFGAGGARFVLIKRTDDTGGWYVYDTARGMTVLTDPYLFLNSTAAESATLGSVTTVSTGFALNSTILADINASGGSFIFLAIA